MGKHGVIKISDFAVLACSALLTCSAALAVEPPGWWDNPSPETSVLVYEKGSSGPCPCRKEEEARQKAYDAGLATLRKQITSDTNLWPRIQFPGSDIAFESIQQDSRGGWYAWVLVSFPRALFETALQRADDLSKKAQERIPVFVLPVAFGKEAEAKFPELVEKFKALGYGNGIWLTVEPLLYEEGYEIVTAPSTQVKGMQELMSGNPTGQTAKLPDAVVVCNMNFFKVETESTSWFRVARNSEYQVELLLEWYEGMDSRRQVRIPSKGEATDKDLLVATQQAAERAVSNLMGRIRWQ